MKTGSAGQNGRGRTPASTEDRSFIRELPGEILLAGVLDGHSGSFTAEFTLKKFPDYIATIIAAADNGRSEDALVKGLKAAFIEHDKLIANQGAIHYRESGSTATIAIVTPKSCIIAYIGDSPACVLDPDTGKVINVIGKHDPADPGEERRIVKNGGHVTREAGDVPRVNGELAVSRAFGDFSFKDGATEKKPVNWATDFHVVADPDIMVFPRPAKGVLAIFSDGLVETESGDFKPIATVAASIQQAIKATGDLRKAAELTIRKHVEESAATPAEYDGDDTTLVLVDISLPVVGGERHTRRAKVKRVRTKTHVKKLPKTFLI